MYDVLYYFLLSDFSKELKLIEKFRSFEGIIIVYYKSVSHRLGKFHEDMVRQGFKEIENIKYLRVYKKGVKKL